MTKEKGIFSTEDLEKEIEKKRKELLKYPSSPKFINEQVVYLELSNKSYILAERQRLAKLVQRDYIHKSLITKPENWISKFEVEKSFENLRLGINAMVARSIGMKISSAEILKRINEEKKRLGI